MVVTLEEKQHLIQNFIFKDNNISGRPFGFLYNSWLELNYITTQAVNLGKNELISNVSTRVDRINYGIRVPKSNTWSINNYYGYPTKDILSSISYFRNGDDLNIQAYSLGWKFKRYEQFIPDNGEFLNPFDNYEETRTVTSEGIAVQEQGVSEYPGMKNFFDQGWTFSTRLNQLGWRTEIPGGDSRTLYRFSSNTEQPYPINESGGYYGVPDESGYNLSKMVVQLNNPILAFDGYADDIESEVGQIRLDNTYTKLPRNKYTILEFKLDFKGATFSNDLFYYPLSIYPPGTQSSAPRNYNLLDDFTYLGTTFSREGYTLQDGTFVNYEILPTGTSPYTWPINHLNNFESVKVEYFYNKPDISFYFYEDIDNTGPNNKRYYFDFIRYTEVDMIPFFRYATGSRITSYPQSPLSSVAPFIDYTNSEFSLIDNINISEANFSIEDNVVSLVSSSGFKFSADEEASPASTYAEFLQDIEETNSLLNLGNTQDIFSSAGGGGLSSGDTSGGISTGDTIPQSSKGTSKGA